MASVDPFAQLLSVAASGLVLSPPLLRERGELTKQAAALGLCKSTLWARWNPQKIDKAKKAQQARRWRELVMRPMWNGYFEAHSSRWPGQQPMGFGRFIASGAWRVWKADPEALLASPNERTWCASVKAWERAGRRAGYETKRGLGQ